MTASTLILSILMLIVISAAGAMLAAWAANYY
jgi:hypothetical protein